MVSLFRELGLFFRSTEEEQYKRKSVMSQKRDWNAFNKDVIEQFRANGGQVPGREHPLILLTTTGAKSGLPRINPLNYSTDGDRIIVIASKGGSPTHPD
jgi:hypothetical protein